MDHTQDLYGILGISAEADIHSIKAAYRQAARRLHPDVNPHKGAALQFQDIVTAYETLNNDLERQRYNMLRGRLAADPLFFTVQATPSKRVLPIMGENQVLYVLVQIMANPSLTIAHQKPAPLNMVLVLDRSKSMRGARLDRVKVAAHQIIEQLGENDYLSLVVFSDRAEALITSQPVSEKNNLKSIINTMTADGGTEIFQGLREGFKQVKRHYNPDYVNHIILLTDGETYDDTNLSLELADEAIKKGVGISTMGIGDEWDDVFLDQIASKTGGTCAFVNSPGAVVRFLNDRVRSLGSALAERMCISIAPDSDIKLESVFKLTPNPQPIDHETQPIQLGALEGVRPLTLLVQLLMPAAMQESFRTLLRLDVTGDILSEKRHNYKVISDLSIEAATSPLAEDPPRIILDALGKLTLYRMQQKAEAAIQAGNFDEATRRLENLATRLLAAGQDELARTAMMEAQRVKQTRTLSEEGRKTIKFGTRMLLLGMGEEG